MDRSCIDVHTFCHSKPPHILGHLSYLAVQITKVLRTVRYLMAQITKSNIISFFDNPGVRVGTSTKPNIILHNSSVFIMKFFSG